MCSPRGAMRLLRTFLAVVPAPLLLPSGALAHSARPGLDGVAQGVFHPLSEPAQILALLALALVLSRQQPGRAGIALAVFALGMVTILTLSWFRPIFMPFDVVLLGTALGLGALEALGTPLPLGFALAMALTMGGLIGLASWPGSAPLAATVATVAGSVVGASLLVLGGSRVVAVLRQRIDRTWVGTAQRIAGSWIAAISALTLAVALAR